MLRAFTALFIFLYPLPALAQLAWVQVEAQPNLAQAQTRAQAYARAFSEIQGYRIGRGWYALALGPYATPQIAQRRLRELRSAGIIPQDSFIVDGRRFRDQFWPVGGGTTGDIAVQPLPDPQAAAPSDPPLDPPSDPGPQQADETREQARTTERLLSRKQRQDLQTALQWFGYYSAAIDGAFGRGTRNSMARWQTDKGYTAHGILTTQQRAELLADYAHALTKLGLGEVDDEKAGIKLTMPTGLVEFAGYDYPFVRFNAKDGSGVQVLLISQPGDTLTLAGLYEIMQTLEIIPLEGPRNKKRNGFTLEGINDQIQSYTEVSLSRGNVKGFTIAYPPEKASEMARVIKIMQDSFAVSEGHLEPTDTDEAAQSADLLAGLELRKPKRAYSGFFVDGQGRAVTVVEAVESCERVTLDESYDVDVTALGNQLALLTPKDSLVPLNYARFAQNLGLLRSSIVVSGYSYGGSLAAPSVTFGTLEDIRGLDGNSDVKRLDVKTLEGDVGGPVLDMTGAVSGLLLGNPQSARTLPDGTVFAATSQTVSAFLTELGVNVQTHNSGPTLPSEDLLVAASDMTVLVSCW